ncbi:acetolactate synthase large subunit [Sciscionella marina]|uniref:acetolactate synthase large subunit n=1 Tax=Sciscionella marina TaxID=508770 RepID=UPI00036082BB|nr:acetolactate synthase large subunit [Sciscionella marina]
MNGAHALLGALVDAGVEVCFANPGTSEMHFVAALDEVEGMRAVLGLYEGVVTGAADGYARMAGKPAATLLHLGPGMANGWANLHNARRAHSPMITIVGDHATHHRHLDAPLTSDIAALAGAVSVWTRECTCTEDLVVDVAEAVGEANGAPHGIATLILPADVSWSEGGTGPVEVPETGLETVPGQTVTELAALLRAEGERACLLLGGETLGEQGLRAADRIAANTGARVFAEHFPARMTRGRGLPQTELLGYLAEHVQHQLTGFEHLVLAGTPAPVSFFAYPGRPSELTPEGARVHTLATVAQHGTAALTALAELTGDRAPEPPIAPVPELPDGALTPTAFTDVIGALLPPDTILVDESNTSGVTLPASTLGSPRHDLLTLTGGAIGQAMAVATGAAIACPDRPVLCLEADGSAMYGPAALWTMARERQDVTTVFVNNRSYAVLRMELARVGAREGEQARRLLSLTEPELDFVALATGMGVPARRADTCEEFATALRESFAEPGPHVIEAVITPW